ncbi:MULTISPECIES: PLP-dependent aminotransferase family protein [unclassified Acinetobacter]|uniref:aminotransferase-like domain-containing protein n=1 Tax=unclassified Acinetobacter TaxID=196816 RepID=UPI00190ABBDE|nr:MULTISPECIES: PLP-dependent aminotransferase family protein [unclassified Acinetobacter]MBK0063309.1 PLP-dependent aminotransferase family protein [Acinetobacter sp. S55]MBK0066779.1 PLP-dependent aminotransferase family protein [Acinetobacter sp. S54]
MTKIEQVIHHIDEQLKSRRLTPGMRLASIRALAKELNFSVATIVEAYERLASLGIIESRAGAGFFVCAPLEPLILSHIDPIREKNLDPLWISRQLLEAPPQLIKLGCGWLPDDWMPHETLRKAIRDVSKGSVFELVNYSPPLGLLGLRELLARRLYTKGIEVTPQQILLTDSGSYSIDLICRFLLKPNDVVLVDDPCYFNFRALLKVHQVKIIGIPYTAQGPDIDAFKHAIEEHRPRMYITNSGIHNPTGATLSQPTAHQLVSLIEQANMVVIEDDIFSDFETTHSPRFSALDGLKHSIYIGSFSKTLSASVRCGYIVAKTEWIDHLVDLKVATSFSHSNLSAQILYKTLTEGGYRKHMEQLKSRLAEARQFSAQMLEKLGIKLWIMPKAGIFLWCELPADIDIEKMVQYCAEKGVILALGNSFSQSDKFQQFLRFNVAQCMHRDVYAILQKAMHYARRS